MNDPVECKDCGKPYSSFELDATLPDKQWRSIMKKDEVMLLLCANCIVARASELGGVVAVRMELDFGEGRTMNKAYTNLGELGRGTCGSLPQPAIPCRQYCAICGNLYAVDFHVPDDMWQECIHSHYQNSTVCLNCFIVRADEKLVEWCREVKLYPKSLVEHLRDTRPEHFSLLDVAWRTARDHFRIKAAKEST